MRHYVLIGLVLAGLPIQAADVDITKAPATQAIPDLKLPPISRFQLPNGLQVVTARDSRLPLVTAQIAFLAGSRFDAGMPGLSESVATLLNQGTAAKSAQQIAESAADLGGSIEGRSFPDELVVSGTCLAENTKPFLALMADVARNASFPEDEVQLQKVNRKEALKGQHAEAQYLADEAVAKVLLGNHPYGHIGPTDASLDKLTRAALTSFRDTYLVPNNAYLIVVGDLPTDEKLKAMLTEQFGSWAQKGLPQMTAAATPKNRKQLVLVDRPGSVQADIVSAHIAPTYGSAEFFPLQMGTQVIGVGPMGRLFRDIREQRGYAYDAHAEFNRYQQASVTRAVTQVRNEVAGPALEALNKDLAQMGTEQVTASELSAAKDAYVGRFMIQLEPQSGLAAQLARIEIMRLPKDFLETVATRIRSVEPDQIQKTGKYWSPDDATLVVVGDAAKLKPSLDKLGTVQVIQTPGSGK